MPKIKHIALATQDVEKTAKFYMDVFGMKEIAKIDSPNASGYYLSDGDLNLAILDFKNDAVAGVERGKDWSGIHHIGFQVDDIVKTDQALKAAGVQPVPMGEGYERRAPEPMGPPSDSVNLKYLGPDAVQFDVRQRGWDESIELAMDRYELTPAK